MTEKEMTQIMRGFIEQPRFSLANMYVFGWESDLLLLTRAGIWYELEMKASRSDFLADAKKTTRRSHDRIVLKSAVLKGEDDNRMPNYFYYVVPQGMIGKDDVPSYAGVIYILNHGGYMVVKKAPLLHKAKIDPKELNLLDRFYYNMVNARNGEIVAKRSEKEAHARYADVDELIKRERGIERQYASMRAEIAFKQACPEHVEFGCALGGRCGGKCAKLERFMEMIDKAK